MSRTLFLCIVYGVVLGCEGMAISTYSPDTPGMFIPRPSSGVTTAETHTINTNRKKKTTMMVSSILKYLRKFKYLDPSPCPSCEQDSSIISEALSTLQQWAHINNTGILDSDTVEVMSKRRCGVPDEPKQFSVSSNKNRRHKRSFFWHIYHGSRWYKNDLTYIINMPHKFPNKRAVEKIIRAALHAWESVTQLTFRQKRYGSADIEVNFLTGRHGDGSPFDGNGGILAHAFFPYDNSPGLSGDAHFDADEDWGSEMDLNTTADLYCVAVHEFGHSLGLMHSRWPISIMWPWMKGDCTLSKFDIAVIQKIYGGADARRNRLYHMMSGKRRLKVLKPRFRKKIGMQQFIQSLRFIPPHGSPLHDTKLDRTTTLSSRNPNMEPTMKTLLTPPTNNTSSHASTSDSYLISREILHRSVSPPTSHTTQKWIGDTQRSNFQAEEAAKNYLRESLRILLPNQQTTPMMQDSLRQQTKFRDRGYNNRNYNSLQTETGLGQEILQTASETIFHRIVTPHQHWMMPLSNYAKKSKDNQEDVGSSSRILHKRSLQEDISDLNTMLSKSPTSDYSQMTATLPALILQSTLHGPPVDHQIVTSNPMKNLPKSDIRHSETDQTTAEMTVTTITERNTMQPWCSGSITVDGATVDKNGTINIFKGSNVMRFPFCAKRDGNKQRTFVPIFKIFPNGPHNISAAVSIALGRKKTWERTYLFQGRFVWRYRQCRRGYCLDRGYPINTHQEFNVSIPIEVTAAYMNNRRRTLFLFNGTSFYHSVRCLRWLRRNGCSSTKTEMRPGLLASLRGIDATFTHQGIFYVVHGGGFFMTTLRSMKANAFQYGSIAENWYGCPAKNIFNQTSRT